METKPKIIFMGTPEFAVPTLEKLHLEFGVSLVVTNPDKPAGRGLKPTPSPVKVFAQSLEIPILQPEKIKDQFFYKQIQEFEPDIIVVVAFKILPPEVFTAAKIATFNVHPSLLPKYRGPAPLNWQIINGEKETGLTTFVLQEEVDAGNIILQWKYPIPDGFTAGDLHDFLAPRAGDIAVKTCKMLLEGNYTLQKQDETLATKAPKIFPEQCQIDWSKDCQSLRNFIHGVSPIPGAWTLLNGKRLKIYRCKYLIENHCDELGKPTIKNENLMFPCSNGYIIPEEVQMEGKRKMTAEEFIRGYRV
ncbi:methionyl-tRNA formyltransferase [Bacteroidetes/Chlorobi group bacterium Naka2016]|jgi:methionyl-tRNA formyltransferase|nr:MAG: methionyl-tRNA formyltransferase [Bacteroidetes/Chlorobi group bacterium Naka2016]